MHVFYDPLTFWTTSNIIIEPPTNREIIENLNEKMHSPKCSETCVERINVSGHGCC